jgi:purine nucleosidase
MGMDGMMTSDFLRRMFLAAALLAAGRASAAGEAGMPVPLPLIFDTDMCGDCDDVLALGMIHSLESRGACRLLAVTVSADHDRAAPFVDAVNDFYGRGGIPIGVVGKGGVVEKSGFLSLADQRDDGTLRYPRDLDSAKSVPAATSVLRAALQGQPDGSVAVVQVGFATNLARLLESPPDDVSPLDGLALVRKKVRLLSLMAGDFAPRKEGDRPKGEYNVVKDVPSSRTLAARWPTPMIWSGFEIGIALPYPAVSIERDYGYVPHHPVADAYVRRNPPPHNRPTWDLTSVLQAVHPDRGYFDLSPPGTVSVDPDGVVHFAPDPAGLHRHLILRPEQRPRVLEAEVQLSSQPPASR